MAWLLLHRLLFSWTAVVFFSSWPEYSRGKDPRQREFVQGSVTDFRPMPYEGHQDECFTVQTKTFCYSDYEMGPGFHNSASHGGPIRQGLPVRVFYVGNMIVRLEVRADALPPQADRTAAVNQASSAYRARISNDPGMLRINMGFAVATLFLTGWWNLQPQRFMRFWAEPPYKDRTILAFRIFFAANLAGALIYLVQGARRFPGTAADYRGAAEAAAGWILGVWAIVRIVEMFEVRRRRHSAAG